MIITLGWEELIWYHEVYQYAFHSATYSYWKKTSKNLWDMAISNTNITYY